MKLQRNRHGTRLGKNGYVLCSQCGVEIEEISRDTAPRDALCKRHGTWATNQILAKESVEDES